MVTLGSVVRIGMAAAVGAAALALAGCQAADPGASAMPMGSNCQSVRAQLNKLDQRGVPAKIEAARAGKKLPPAQQAEVDQYNQLLGQYLGSRCHV